MAATESTGGEHRWVPGVTRNSLQAAAPADVGPRRSVRHQAVDQHPPFDHRPSGQRLGWLGALTLYVGEALLVVNKDRAAECERTARLVDREPVIGTFRLLAFNDGILEWEFRAPADGERNDDETAPPDDVAAIAALNPPPETIDDAPNAWDGGSSAQPTHYERGVNFEIGETER